MFPSDELRLLPLSRFTWNRFMVFWVCKLSPAIFVVIFHCGLSTNYKFFFDSLRFRFDEQWKIIKTKKVVEWKTRIKLQFSHLSPMVFLHVFSINLAVDRKKERGLSFHLPQLSFRVPDCWFYEHSTAFFDGLMWLRRKSIVLFIKNEFWNRKIIWKYFLILIHRLFQIIF